MACVGVLKLYSVYNNVCINLTVFKWRVCVFHKKYESVAALNCFVRRKCFAGVLSQAIECGQLVSFSLLDRILVNFYHCFSGVAQVCRDAAGK